MDFKGATDYLFDSVSHDELAKKIGVSIASIRQARLSNTAKAHREPPRGWEKATVALARARIAELENLIATLDNPLQAR